jgi:hypothetical protein
MCVVRSLLIISVVANRTRSKLQEFKLKSQQCAPPIIAGLYAIFERRRRRTQWQGRGGRRTEKKKIIRNAALAIFLQRC